MLTRLRWSAHPLDAAALDAQVDAWLAERDGLVVAFERDDALAKLGRYRLLEALPGELLRAVALEETLARPGSRWEGSLQNSPMIERADTATGVTESVG